MTQSPKQYHKDYYYGPVGMTEHNDWHQDSEDPRNQRSPHADEAHVSREPIHVTDDKLEQQVIALLAQDPNLDPSEIEVGVTMGEVVLKGTVPSRWMKQKVLADIAALSGVKDVDNQLLVDRPADRETA